MSIDLGRVMPVPKGAYDATTAYTRLDIVTSGGSSYMCLVSNTGKAVTDATYWLLLAKAGSDGKPGADGKDGDTGADGADGAQGPAGTITVGTVSTGDAGTNATVTNVGTANAAKFNFTIPRGATGATGAASQIIDSGSSTTNGRGIDCPPSYYQTNYPAKVVPELKITGQLGVKLIDGQTSDYGILTTEVPGVDVSYGRPRQTFEPTQTTRPLTYTRIGISDTAWSDWELVTTW